MRMRGGLAIMLLCLAASGGRAQKAETQFDRNTDFSRYKTYAWREFNLLTQQNPQNEKLIEHSFVDAVNAQLKTKGLTETQNNPDFYLSYHGGSGMTEGQSGSAMKPHEVSNPSTMGTTFTTNTIPGSIPNVWVEMHGAVVFEVTDAKSNAVVWSSTVSKKIKKPGHMPNDLDQQTAKIAQVAFRKFPPKSRGK
jgi:Domain of unknown function (DUF4136)